MAPFEQLYRPLNGAAYCRCDLQWSRDLLLTMLRPLERAAPLRYLPVVSGETRVRWFRRVRQKRYQAKLSPYEACLLSPAVESLPFDVFSVTVLSHQRARVDHISDRQTTGETTWSTHCSSDKHQQSAQCSLTPNVIIYDIRQYRIADGIALEPATPVHVRHSATKVGIICEQ